MATLGVRVEEDRAVIEIPSDFHSSKAEEILMWIKEFKDPSVQTVVFDFSACKQIALNVYPTFGRIKVEINRLGLQYYSVDIADRVYARLASDGVNGLFAYKKAAQTVSGSQSTGSKVPSPAAKLIDSAENINMMVAELIHALHSTNVEAQCGKPFLKNGPVFPGVGVIGIMPLATVDFKGAIRLSAPQEFAIQLHKDLFAQDVTEASDETIEILEEMTAVFFMYLKTRLKEKGIELMNAAPSVLVGLPANVQQSETAQTMVLPFTSKYGGIFLEIVLA
jgi:CheY-specific phosphatase CheX